MTWKASWWITTAVALLSKSHLSLHRPTTCLAPMTLIDRSPSCLKAIANLQLCREAVPSQVRNSELYLVTQNTSPSHLENRVTLHQHQPGNPILDHRIRANLGRSPAFRGNYIPGNARVEMSASLPTNP